MIRVVLADDHEIVRSGFRMLLESAEDIEVVGEAADGMQAYNLVARLRPDVLLLDISMPPGQNGLIACQNVAHDCPDTKIIVLTMFAEEEYLQFTIKNGAAGYVVKNASSQELREAVHTVVAGGTYIHPSMQKAFDDLSQRSSADNSLETLTPRELEILQLIARGYTNKQISDTIYLSVKTVEAHRAKLYAKLGLKNRSDAVDYAIKHKIMNV